MQDLFSNIQSFVFILPYDVCQTWFYTKLSTIVIKINKKYLQKKTIFVAKMALLSLKKDSGIVKGPNNLRKEGQKCPKYWDRNDYKNWAEMTWVGLNNIYFQYSNIYIYI